MRAFVLAVLLAFVAGSITVWAFVPKPEPKVIAFDCFGTVFDMKDVPKEEIADYVKHVKANNFSPYEFPSSWWNLKHHVDSPYGIKRLQDQGFLCVALSNGSVDLIEHISAVAGIKWDHIVNLAEHQVYKPNSGAYQTIKFDLRVSPSRTIMVTANPTFGDIEGSRSIGMLPIVIRGDSPIRNIIELSRIVELAKD